MCYYSYNSYELPNLVKAYMLILYIIYNILRHICIYIYVYIHICVYIYIHVEVSVLNSLFHNLLKAPCRMFKWINIFHTNVKLFLFFSYTVMTSKTCDTILVNQPWNQHLATCHYERFYQMIHGCSEWKQQAFTFTTVGFYPYVSVQDRLYWHDITNLHLYENQYHKGTHR